GVVSCIAGIRYVPVPATKEDGERMATTSRVGHEVDLSEHGIRATGRVLRNPSTATLYTHALTSGEGVLAESGPLVVDTGRFTGRSPKDKFVVREPSSEERIWWGDVNRPISEEHFEGLRDKVADALGSQDVYAV